VRDSAWVRSVGARGYQPVKKPFARTFSLHKHLKNEEAHDDSLEEKGNCVKLMIALVSRDRGSNQACEINHTADEIRRPQGKKVRNAF
jgi:hypothetical protein